MRKQSEIRLEVGEKWKLFAPKIPEGAEGIGMIEIDGQTSALVRLRNATLVRMNGNVIRSLSFEVVCIVNGII